MESNVVTSSTKQLTHLSNRFFFCGQKRYEQNAHIPFAICFTLSVIFIPR